MHHGVAFLPPLSYEVGTNQITRTIIIPPVERDGVSSISVIGVASDGSEITTFLYFIPSPEQTTTFIRLDLFLA